MSGEKKLDEFELSDAEVESAAGGRREPKGVYVHCNERSCKELGRKYYIASTGRVTCECGAIYYVNFDTTNVTRQGVRSDRMSTTAEWAF